MATSTENFKFKKPDESDFYDIQDQNGNWDIADQELEKLNNPTFEDYTGGTSVPAAGAAIEALKSKSKLGALLSNIKAAFKGACLIGHIVNNCVTDNPNLPLSAAQGKALMDLYNVLNTNQQNFLKYNGTFYGDANTVDQSGYWQLVERNGSNLPDSTESHYGTFINFITQYPLQIVALAYFDTHVVYIRIKRDNTWSSWKEI